MRQFVHFFPNKQQQLSNKFPISHITKKISLFCKSSKKFTNKESFLTNKISTSRVICDLSKTAPIFSSYVSKRGLCTLDDLYNGILKGERSKLAKAITLVESSRSDHRKESEQLIYKLLRKTQEKSSFRIGISGPPGVGKSTFIEAIGTFLIVNGYKVAVLAIDPSSTRSGGSILGDVTRMLQLSRETNAFIRGSPTRGTLGGVARSTHDSIVLCEAAGYNVIIVETVGVGQSETAVEGMTDMFLLLLPPAGGDELQGIKKGIMELVDLVVINKADGDLLPIANRAASEYKSALHMINPKSTLWQPRVQLCSALTKNNIDQVWKNMKEYWQLVEVIVFLVFRLIVVKKSGRMQSKRGEQRKSWLWKIVQEDLMNRFVSNSQVQLLKADIEKQVEEGSLTSGLGSSKLISAFLCDEASKISCSTSHSINL